MLPGIEPLGTAPLERSSGTPLLSLALKRGISISKVSGSEFCWAYAIDLSMLRLLLNLGASPNQNNIATGGSIWEDFIQECLAVRSKQRPVEWDLTKFLHPDEQAVPQLSNIFEACELMILHGARSSISTQMIRECFTDKEARQLEGRNPPPVKKGSTWWKLWHVF